MLLPNSRYYGPVKLSTTRSVQYIELIVATIQKLSIVLRLFLLAYHRYKMIVTTVHKIPSTIKFCLLTIHRYRFSTETIR
jgi:hypothetical protein